MGYPTIFLVPVVKSDDEKSGIMLVTPKDIIGNIVALWTEWYPLNNMLSSNVVMWNSTDFSFEPVFLTTEMKLAVTTTLTIYRHPMPETEGE